MEIQQQPPPPPSCWSSIVKQTPQSKPPPPPPSSLPPLIPLPTAEEQTSSRVGSCNSAKGIAIAIVDANAIIQGGGRLAVSADRFISVPEVISEIRDPNSRHSLNLLPFTVDTIEPSPESLKKVITFARATGDLQTLSDVDLKLIALTYTMEAQIHGTQHLRESPPPIHTVNVKRLPEKELPGWGNNVPNLEEWEALEQAIEEQSNFTSRILPLKDLNLNVLPEDQSDGSIVDEEADNNGRKYKKKEVKIDEKKIVIDGIDASQGQIDTNGDDWLPAVSRSTHRRFLRRKARRDISEVSSEKDTIEIENENTESENKVNEEKSSDISTIMGEMKLNEESLEALEHGEDIGEDNEGNDEESEDFEEESEIDTSNVDDNGSEQSWMLKSLSESSVACITSDFAMQNVLLQMGLRLLAPGGMQIRELNRWVLKCHACFKVTTDIGRIFCPSCGNGGTLRKVSVTVGENGIILAARKPRTSLRGTKFSLPSPQGGRDAITKNPVLREDQLPKKFLYPKTKKKNKGDDDMFASTDLFLHQNSEKRAPLQPPVRKALAVFSQRRNPNDNHYSRVMH